jgi:radical SAM protein with 4Fe4S-binding SPASM domain
VAGMGHILFKEMIMLYRQKFDTFIRIYEKGTEDAVGYIVSKNGFGERATESSGAVFLSALSRKPKSLDEHIDEIARSFIDVDRSVLRQDIVEFYKILEDDGLIVSGQTQEELDSKDSRFSYSDIDPKSLHKNFTPLMSRAKMSTQEYFKDYFKEKPHLTSLHIELTSRCNERCVHCYIPHENKLQDIEPELFYSVLEQCRELGVLGITLSGGEPLVHKHFLIFLRKLKEYDFSINIFSNLTLLNDEIITEIKDIHLSSIHVSLYSMKPEIHDSITKVPGSFLKTRDSILRLIENDIPIRISCPTMKQNKDDYTDVLNWARDHKIRATTDYIMMARYDHTTDNLDNRLSLDEIETLVNEIVGSDTVYQKEILSGSITKAALQDTSNDNVCVACMISLCMVSNGNIYPCAGWQNFVCGNVFKTPLKEIWEKSPKVQYLRSLRKKDFPECLHCADKGFCSMCMVRNANEDPNGNPLHINRHFCQVAALNRKIVFEWKKRLENA